MRAKWVGSATAVLIGLSGAPAADFSEGVAAYERGDYARSLNEFRVLADEGNPYAQYNIGVQYYKGEGVARDDTEAARWFLMAAEQGVASAQQILGAMYFKGEGVAQDYIRAYAWFNTAAEAGDTVARQNREVMSELMTPVQLKDAETLSREYAEKYPKLETP
ncbi:MAG: sel1 repeat family protein [Gammaproteobacteria bacterium]|nr:sel1 repeat family protein [Gammaproteobacteria bacterium]MCI0590773.1 sel1 repeat family protein [Gammaproteobacteria bacterium]